MALKTRLTRAYQFPLGPAWTVDQLTLGNRMPAREDICQGSQDPRASELFKAHVRKPTGVIKGAHPNPTSLQDHLIGAENHYPIRLNHYTLAPAFDDQMNPSVIGPGETLFKDWRKGTAGGMVYQEQIVRSLIGHWCQMQVMERRWIGPCKKHAEVSVAVAAAGGESVELQAKVPYDRLSQERHTSRRTMRRLIGLSGIIRTQLKPMGEAL